ncbi:TIGR03016 family PEP-CTERM system-associated outer membrane protein [Roseateles puraquae]|nr:TIGR03016 family PEP-CTERM system-associated outer membrane protein [Roseateles puraquae]
MAAMTRLRPETRLLPLAVALLSLAAQAQEGQGGRGAITPRFSLTQTWTDNLRLSDQNKDAALITTVSPGISVSRNSGTFRGSLDYSLNGISYLKTDVPSQIQNALSANLQAELLPQTLTVEAQANIARQNVSAFGQQANSVLGTGGVSPLSNLNSREVGSLTVSPQWRSQLGGLAAVSLRGNLAMTEVRGSALGDSRSTGATLQLTQLSPGILGWYAQASTQQMRPKLAQANRNSTLTLGANYRPDPDLALSANVGEERSNYLSASGEANDSRTWGVTGDWTPTSRTRLSANYQSHRYGDTRGLVFEHRMRNSVWRYSDTRSVIVGNSGSSGSVRTNYDLYSLLLTSVEPDPVKRDALVRAALQSLGLSPDAPVSQGFLSSGPSQTRSQQLSFTLQGVRTNVTAAATRTLSSRLGSGLNQGDLATNAFVEQRSYSLSGSYQLSPVSGLSLTASRQESQGDGTGRATQLTSWFANWNTRLGSGLSVQLGARHSRFESTAPYSENSVYGTVSQQF